MFARGAPPRLGPGRRGGRSWGLVSKGAGLASLLVPALLAHAGAKLTLLSPNGGETVVVGAPLDVRWTSEGAGETVNILASSDGGGWWDMVAAAVPNDGAETISLESVGTQWLVRVEDSAREPWNPWYDDSDAPFVVDDGAGDGSMAGASVVGPGVADYVAVGEDWHRLDLPDGEPVTVALRGEPGSALLLEVVGEDGTLLASSCGAADPTLQVRDVPGAAAFLHVASVDGTPAAYTLLVGVGEGTVLGVRDGEDWSLPRSVVRDPDSGYFSFNSSALTSRIPIGGVNVPWSTLNPAEGVYDWSPIWSGLARTEGTPYRSWIKIESTERDSVPDWVMDRYDPPTFVSTFLSGELVCPWDPGVEAAYTDFMRALGEQRFGDQDNVLFTYVHGTSSGLGEEMILFFDDFVQAESVWGLTPDVYREWGLRRLDLWLDAFAGHASKVMWVGHERTLMYMHDSDAYGEASAALVEHMRDAGGSFRDGIIEQYNGRLYPLSTGQRNVVDPHGDDAGGIVDTYLVTDLDDPLIAERRATADENEVYDDPARRNGSPEEDPYFWRSSNLRALSMQLRLLYTVSEAYAIDPELSDYVNKSLGKDPARSVDAWTDLREDYTTDDLDDPKASGWHDVAMHNFERYLYQRDLPGAMTVPVEPVERIGTAGAEAYMRNPPWGSGPAFDYTARRTDVANGSDRIAFDVEDRWLDATPSIVEMQVTWKDEAGTAWHVAYANGDGQAAESATVEAEGSNGTRTTSVLLAPATMANSLATGPDLALVSDRGDPTVSRVRLVSWGAPVVFSGRGGACGEDGWIEEDPAAVDGAGPGGCGCSAAAGRGGFPFVGFLALVALMRRRTDAGTRLRRGPRRVATP